MKETIELNDRIEDLLRLFQNSRRSKTIHIQKEGKFVAKVKCDILKREEKNAKI